MFLVAVAVLVVATLTAYASSHNADNTTETKADYEQGQAAYSNRANYNGATMRFVN
jgi:hypothetical protein